MFIEPGIFDAAHAKGIERLNDMNADQKIDSKDLALALKARAPIPTS